MSQLSLIIMSILMGFTFMSMNHPLAMGLVLLIQTMLITLLTGLMAPSFWFSYILFLVFLGGMLVLFIYVTSLASNEMFSVSWPGLMIWGSLLGLFLLSTMFNDSLIWVFLNSLDQTISIWGEMNLNVSILLSKIYNLPTYSLTLMLVFYLFLTLIAVVTITNIYEGPLRSKN